MRRPRLAAHAPTVHRSGRSEPSRAGLLLFAAFWLSACADIPTERVELEVFSWWDEDSEQEAFEAIKALHQAAHPEVDVVNSAEPNADVARERLAKRMTAGAPPATFQANVGADLLRWAALRYGDAPDRYTSEERLMGLGDLFEELDLRSVLQPELVPALELEPGTPYGIPINIHRLNVLYYNVEAEARARRAGVDLFALETWCALDTLPAEVRPRVALGTKQSWTLLLLTFENLLPALAGADYYRRFWTGQVRLNGPSSADRAAMTQVLQCLVGMSGSFIDDYASKSWSQAVDALRSPGVAAAVMGDWASARLTDELERGVVASRPFPGTNQLVVFTSDTFPLPSQTPHPEAARDLLRTLSSKAAQVAFSRVKGSIPARHDVDVAELGEQAELSLAHFERASEHLVATSGLIPPYYPLDELAASLERLVARRDEAAVTDVITLLADAAPLLVRWHDTASGAR